MPLEHSEDMAMQYLLVSEHAKMFGAFEELVAGGEESSLNDHDVVGFRKVLVSRQDSFRKFRNTTRGVCEEHRDVVRRFGRFPKRNRVLGRVSDKAEKEYLEGGGRF